MKTRLKQRSVRSVKVLSLFDGISAGYEALIRAGISVEKYTAYEIDEDAIKIALKNHPDIEEKGSVIGADFTEFKGVDLLIGGSPCQDLSLAGRMDGLQGEQSRLFFEFVRALKEAEPKYFLFENTPMKEADRNIITRELGCEPVVIDASLVSAQMRKRLYWTNIPIGQIEDRGIYLEDVVEKDALVDREKAHAIIGSIGRTTHREYFRKNQGQLVWRAVEFSNIYGGWGEKKPRIHVDKSVTIRTSGGGGHIPSLLVNGKEFTVEDIKKCTRKVTPLECERLMTFPDGYTDVGISPTQRYKCLGNSWVCEVIKEIFKGLKEEKE